MNKYFFLHIPKTAGTSFRLSLLHGVKESLSFPNKFDLKENSGHYPTIPKLEEYALNGKFEHIELFQGHYSYDIMKKYFNGAKVLVFFRSPIDRAISNIKHLSRNAVQYQGMSFEEIAGLNADKPNPQIVNVQTGMVGNGNMKEKIKRMESFEFIGITEDYQKSIELCNYTLGWNIPLDVNVNRAPKGSESISSELIDFLIMHNHHDFMIYEKAKRIFEERYTEITKTKETTER